MQVGSLGPEDPLEEKMATYSSILAWRIPWTEEAGRLQSRASQESNMTEHPYMYAGLEVRLLEQFTMPPGWIQSLQMKRACS